MSRSKPTAVLSENRMSSTGARYGIVSPRACCVPITRDIKLKPGFGKAARGRGKGASDVRVVEPSEAAIREAGRVLREAGLVAMPTETVCGLHIRCEGPSVIQPSDRAR